MKNRFQRVRTVSGMWCRFPPLLLLLVFLFLSVAPAAAQDGWDQWRGSPTHLGQAGGDIPEEGMLRWRYRTGDQVQSSPVFRQGQLLMGSDDGRLYCLDAETGELIWKFGTGGAVQATVLLAGDKAYFGSADGFFYCLELPSPEESDPTPKEVWKYDCEAPIASSAHPHQDALLFGCHDGYLYSLDLEGELNWRTEVGWELWASPLVDAETNRAYIGAINGSFACVDTEDGSVVWWAEAGEVYSSGSLQNGTLYLTGGIDQRLYALSAKNGSRLWEFDTGQDTYSTPSVLDGRLYFGSFQYAWCLPTVDPNGDGVVDGSEMLWSRETYDVQGGSSPLLAGGKVYIGSDDHNLYCLEQGNGSVAWTFQTEGFVYSSPVLHQGALYVGSSDGYIYCLGERLPRLAVQLEMEKVEMTSGERLPILLTVKDPFGKPAQNASIAVVLSAGSYEFGEGTGQQGKTNGKGEMKLIYIPPEVSSRSTIEIVVTAEKGELLPGSTSALVIVEPGNGGEADSEPVDLEAERRPYYALLAVFLVFDIALVAVILKTKKEGGGGA